MRPVQIFSGARQSDYQTALHWAEKVLSHVPNPDGDDLFERADADLIAPWRLGKSCPTLGRVRRR
jgi:hypothetical protein